MTVATNSFDGITPSGTTISSANSGGTSGNAFDTISGTPVSDTTHTHLSSAFSMMVNSSAAAQYVQWTSTTFTSVPGALYWRVYLWMTSLPAAAIQLATLRTASATAGFTNISTTGTVQMKNAASAVQFTSTALATGTWHRIEGLVLGGTTGSDGQLQTKIFSGANSEGSTPDQDSTLLTAQNCGTTGTANTLRLGTSTAITVQFWLDDVGGSTTGFLGPVSSGSSPNAGLAAATGTAEGEDTSTARSAVSLNMTIQGV